VARVSIFLIIVALIAGIVGCGQVTPPTRYNLTMTVAPGDSGTATDLTNASPYAEGTVVSIKAVANQGYQFVNWTAPAGTFGNAIAVTTIFTMPTQNVTVTANFAIEIWDWYDLYAIKDNLGCTYLLMCNLDSTTPGYEELASPTANGGKGWAPIGNFTGTLDGRGYEIRDLFINRPDEADVGLFGYVDEGGVIKDIGVMNIAVTGNSFVGGLVGGNNGTVSNSYSTSSVTGNSFVGGLVGGNNGTVSNSYSTSSVTGNSFVGGLVGVNIYSTVSYSTVSNSYACGNVTGTFFVGGLLGGNAGTGNVSNSYSTGNVTGDSYVGGLVGRNNEEGTVTNSFWDTQTSGQATSAGGTGKTTLEMKDFDTFDGVGWDIILIGSYAGETWYIDDGNDYPRLGWQHP
jgi:uncharacterized repeat protein (TIGR02543 family)